MNIGEYRLTTFRTGLGLCVAAAMAACGGEPQPAADANRGTASATPAAAPTAGDASPGLRCPPRVRDGLVGPEITGVRLGMTADEALATVRCALGEDAVVKTEARWLKTPRGQYLDTHGVELGTQAFTVKAGENRPCDYKREWQSCEGALKWGHVDEIVTVATPGVPGSETAMVVWRTRHFRDGAMPAAETVIQALVEKYGEPQYSENSDKRRGHDAGYRELAWIRDRQGAPLADPNPLYRQCLNAVSGRGESTRVSWQDGCGLNVWARVYLHGQNPGLARELNMGMVRQSELWAHSEATQIELQRLGQAQRDSEVQQAGGADVRL